MILGVSLMGRQQAAIDPIGLFVILIIVVNVVSTFFKRARAQQDKQAATPPAAQLDEAMRKSSADVAATRAAQRARLQRALSATARQVKPPITVPATPVGGDWKVAPKTPVAPAAPPVGGDWKVAPSVAPALYVLPSFEFNDMPALPALTQLAGPVSYVAPPASPLPILQGKFTGADLFIAAAVIGPCAALRTIGHTPAGW